MFINISMYLPSVLDGLRFAPWKNPNDQFQGYGSYLWILSASWHVRGVSVSCGRAVSDVHEIFGWEGIKSESV